MRIEIAGDHHAVLIPRKPLPDLGGLVRIHNDYEIGTVHCRRYERSGSITRQIDAALGAERYRDRWNGPVATDEPRRQYLYLRQGALKHSLQIGTSAYVAIAGYEYSLGQLRLRQPTSRGPISTGVQETVRQVSRCMIRPF